MDEDEDDDERINQFEDGHWMWDTDEIILKFISHKIIVDEEDEPYAPVSDDISFRLDVDLLEQVMFKKKFYRKVKEGKPDVITIQDIKDVVLFTAPKGNLNFKLICTFHTPAYERFTRSLIAYTQFYLQVVQIMKRRCSEGAKKIRLPQSDVIEKTLENNLADFRSLVGRDFLYLHLDDGDIKPRINMISVEMRYTEMLIRVSIQIVWIALLRPRFDTIDTELNRMFRSQLFNLSLHKSSSNTPDLSQYEKAVFYRERKGVSQIIDKFNILSPVAKDLFLYPQDYRHVGIGEVGYKRDTSTLRIEYLDDVFSLPEEKIIPIDLHVGILGEPRNKFDMMLREISVGKTGTGSKSQSSVALKGVISSVSKKSKYSVHMCGTFEVPCVSDSYVLTDTFPSFPPSNRLRPINKKQKMRWLKYIKPKKKKN